MGLLLIIGFIFLGIISHNIGTSRSLQSRSRANDLSEAGIRYAHEQLLRSEQGADWRGRPTPLIDGNGDTTIDPDAFYLRPPANIGGNAVQWPGSRLIDRGGPDGLGPFFRVNFQNGRALVRVRYAPSDANIFSSSPNGALRDPGAARNYILIEAVGRDGVVSSTDPTTVVTQTPRRIRNYPSIASYQSELGAFRSAESKFGGIQINRAFASIGIVESARFITNKYRQSNPADVGIPSDLGASFSGQDIANPTASDHLIFQLGSKIPLLTFQGASASVATAPLGFGGSLFSNADLQLHGDIQANLNQSLGDGWNVAGSISSDADAKVQVNQVKWGTTGWTSTLTNLTGSTLNSKSPSYTTVSGLIRDGSSDRDSAGIPRSVGRKDPPSIEAVDPQTGTNRYLAMTRDSGYLAGTGNSGRFGFGQGVYVNNFHDVQGGSDEAARANALGSGSLINEWLNPGATGSFWKGIFYVPPGAYVQLLSDGFLITRTGNVEDERTWKNPDGSETGVQSVRYRVGRGSDHRPYILSGIAKGSGINGNLLATDFDGGQPFNGTLYFEGNVRVRGIIPTDFQLSIISGATIYVEGSITKGVVGNQYTATYDTRDGQAATAAGARLGRPSKSMLILMAKDYVTLNTTQFFGASQGQDPQPHGDSAGTPSYNPIVLNTGSKITLNSDFILDPEGARFPANPAYYLPYATEYVSTTGTKLETNILIAHTMDDGAASEAFININVNPPAAAGFGTYIFPAGPLYANNALQFGATSNYYGLGQENYQKFNKFESIGLPLIDPNVATVSPTVGITVRGASGNYTLSTQGLTPIEINPTGFSDVATNAYVLGRFAVVPADIRIEASMFAEEGSFFIIPGPWFNPNPNDTREAYDTSSGSQAEKDLNRLTNYGAGPNFPFYGEPIDARIVIRGAISENMPPTAAQQSEWIRKWGWIPMSQGATGQSIPKQHIPTGTSTTATFVPNIIVSYDPVLATGRRFGFTDTTSKGLDDPSTYVRTVWVDYNGDGVQQPNELFPLPPLPRLPVSPTLAYFGEVH